MDKSKQQQRPRQTGWWKSENRGAYSKRVMSKWERKQLKELAEVPEALTCQHCGGSGLIITWYRDGTETEDVCGCKE